MEKAQEIRKLVHVLRRTARMAFYTERTGPQPEAAAWCVEQYNRVLARLREIDPDLGNIFQPLPSGATLTVVGMACKQLAAYYEDEAGVTWRWERDCEPGQAPEAFKEFWRKSTRDLEELGDFVRESVQEWFRQREPKAEGKAEEAGKSPAS